MSSTDQTIAPVAAADGLVSSDGMVAAVGAVSGDQRTLRQLARELSRRKAAVAGLAVFLAIVFVAVFAPFIAPHDPLAQNLGDNFLPPAWKEDGDSTYPLGTDPLGRDILSRLIYGARYSLAISIGSILIGGAIGFLVGLIAGFYGRWTDSALMRLGDIQLAFPFVLFAIAILAVSPDRTIWHLMVVLGISSWVVYARLVRSRVLTERAKDYAIAAQALGAPRSRVLFRYIVPNVWQSLLPLILLNMAYFVIVESLLSFIGLGLSPPDPSWGSILADGRQYMMVDPWMALLPGFAIILTVLSIGLVADGFADILDPKLAHGTYRRVPIKGTGVEHSPPQAELSAFPLISVRNLSVDFPAAHSTVHAVKDVSFDIEVGEVAGVVGESGSGKSTLGLAMIQLLDSPGRVSDGRILFDGKDLTSVSNKEMQDVRGSGIGMIFQDPGNSLNPVLTVGYQLKETIKRTGKKSNADIHRAALDALASVHIADPERVLRAYPFQLSGGMQQRVMIALAMVNRPKLLILDEPTSALDVTTQAQLLHELDVLRREHGTSVLFITHDIALLSEFADTIFVMYAGEICEAGPRRQVLEHPAHPYTKALINAVARVGDSATGRLAAIPGDPPDPRRLPPGCPFAPRCPSVMPVCRSNHPGMYAIGPEHDAACYLHDRSIVRPDGTREEIREAV